MPKQSLKQKIQHKAISINNRKINDTGKHIAMEIFLIKNKVSCSCYKILAMQLLKHYKTNLTEAIA